MPLARPRGRRSPLQRRARTDSRVLQSRTQRRRPAPSCWLHPLARLLLARARLCPSPRAGRPSSPDADRRRRCSRPRLLVGAALSAHCAWTGRRALDRARVRAGGSRQMSTVVLRRPCWCEVSKALLAETPAGAFRATSPLTNRRVASSLPRRTFRRPSAGCTYRGILACRLC